MMTTTDLRSHPWVAVDVATDPVAHSRLLRRAHERGVADDRLHPGSESSSRRSGDAASTRASCPTPDQIFSGEHLVTAVHS
jgi:hypothetical protein